MTETRQAPMTPSGIFHPILDDVVSTTKNWWLLLVAGVAWIVIAVVILRLDYGTVAAIATLFGFFSFLAAANEVVVGVFAFIRPDDTFVGLAAVMSFYFVFRGSFDIAMAFAASRAPGWWVLLLVGLAELAIGFWAAGSWNVSVAVLVSWVAA